MVLGVELNDRINTLATNLSAVVNHMTVILERAPAVPDDEKLVMLSLMDVIGKSFVLIGEAIEKEDLALIDQAVSQAEDTHQKAKAIVNKHPVIMAVFA
jgi:hypothetical protein